MKKNSLRVLIGSMLVLLTVSCAKKEDDDASKRLDGSAEMSSRVAIVPDSVDPPSARESSGRIVREAPSSVDQLQDVLGLGYREQREEQQPITVDMYFDGWFAYFDHRLERVAGQGVHTLFRGLYYLDILEMNGEPMYYFGMSNDSYYAQFNSVPLEELVTNPSVITAASQHGVNLDDIMVVDMHVFDVDQRTGASGSNFKYQTRLIINLAKDGNNALSIQDMGEQQPLVFTIKAADGKQHYRTQPPVEQDLYMVGIFGRWKGAPYKAIFKQIKQDRWRNFEWRGSTGQRTYRRVRP